MDFGLDLVRGAILSGVKAGDSLSAYALMQGDEAALFSGKAYDAMAAARCWSRPVSCTAATRAGSWRPGGPASL